MTTTVALSVALVALGFAVVGRAYNQEMARRLAEADRRITVLAADLCHTEDGLVELIREHSILTKRVNLLDGAAAPAPAWYGQLAHGGHE